MEKETLREKLKILNLSVKEERVLLALQQGMSTPLEISRVTRVTRPAVYDIFKKLKKRGLVESKINNRKKSWHTVSDKQLADTLYETKKVLLQFGDGKEEISGMQDSVVITHRGKAAVKNCFFNIFATHKNERVIGFQGVKDIQGWSSLMTPQETNKINSLIRNNHLIVQGVLSESWIDDAFHKLGREWAEQYAGRTTQIHYIDKKYFNHAGQIFIFKDTIYLVALYDQLIVEIKHSDIAIAVSMLVKYATDTSRAVDVNKRIQELMEKETKVTSVEEGS